MTSGYSQMKVSTRVEYGVLALTDIALYSEHGSSVTTLEIARRQGISKKYLEQILTLLRQAKLIRAQKGLKGGYSLTRPADQITMADILNALDNSILEEMDPPGEEGNDALRYAARECLWGEINARLNGFAKGLTLTAFLDQCRKRMPDDGDMYVI